MSQLGGLHIAVNNAGINKNSAAEDTTEQDWDLTFDLNTKGVFLCCQVGKYAYACAFAGTCICISRWHQRCYCEFCERGQHQYQHTIWKLLWFQLLQAELSQLLLCMRATPSPALLETATNIALGFKCVSSSPSTEALAEVLCLRLQEEGKHMLSQGYGKSINTASMATLLVPHPQKQIAYNASKAAVVKITQTLGTEWADRGLNVNCISPGIVNTALIQVTSCY